METKAADNNKQWVATATGVAISVGVLFLTVWVVSKAWKKGQA